MPILPNTLPSVPPPVQPTPVRRGLWLLPALLSLLFVAGVVLWALRNERDERDEARQTMISDALSLEAQLRAALELEAVHLRSVAAQLSAQPRSAAALVSNPEVTAGFRRVWISVTWLDGKNRILAHVPEQLSAPRKGDIDDLTGVSAHLVARVRCA